MGHFVGFFFLFIFMIVCHCIKLLQESPVLLSNRSALSFTLNSYVSASFVCEWETPCFSILQSALDSSMNPSCGTAVIVAGLTSNYWLPNSLVSPVVNLSAAAQNGWYTNLQCFGKIPVAVRYALMQEIHFDLISVFWCMLHHRWFCFGSQTAAVC